ncbi:MAG: methyltransferase domain-containing protein [Actinobacteria bacterium]|nr:MAG: methyltransferase domain-containing protein [Actinomycetota bacterium]
MQQEHERFAAWVGSLEARHLADLTFAEVSRALRALSSAYVERRHKLVQGAALGGAGKRAAFALFYGPLHYMLVAHVVEQLTAATTGIQTVIDLGCGTGAAGAAWALAFDPSPRIIGIDRHPWALREAAATYKSFGLSAHLEEDDIAATRLPSARRSAPAAILAAFAVNELSDAARHALLPRLIESARRGDRVLVVEPIGGVVARWWDEWRREVERAGGRADEWRFRAELPPIVAKLDRAAGLNHREITGRSLWVNGAASRAASRSPSS